MALLPQAQSVIEQLIEARGLTEGQALVGGVDITKELPADIFNATSYPNQDLWQGVTYLTEKFKKAGAEFSFDKYGNVTFTKGVTLEQLVDVGFEPDYFKDEFKQSLEYAGIKRGHRLSDEVLSKFTAGTLPEVQGMRDQLKNRAFELLGLAEPGVTGGPGDIVGAAGLANLQQDIRGAYSARGLGGAGQAAFFEGTQGIQFLEGLRQNRQQEAFGLISMAYPELGTNFGLQLGQQAFGQQQFSSMFDIQASQIERGRHAAEIATNKQNDLQLLSILLGSAAQGGAYLGGGF